MLRKKVFWLTFCITLVLQFAVYRLYQRYGIDSSGATNAFQMLYLAFYGPILLVVLLIQHLMQWNSWADLGFLVIDAPMIAFPIYSAIFGVIGVRFFTVLQQKVPVDAKTFDQRPFAMKRRAVLCGIFALSFSMIPILGVLASVTGLVFAFRDRKQIRPRELWFGVTVSALALIITILCAL